MGYGYGGYGYGYPGVGYGAYGYPGLGYGFGYPALGYGGYGYGYGYPGLGYGGYGYGYPGLGYGFGGYGFGYGGYAYGAGYGGLTPYTSGFTAPGTYNPLFGLGLTPLGVQSALAERYVLGRGLTGPGGNVRVVTPGSYGYTPNPGYVQPGTTVR
jgi:hypothetical protein